MIRASDSLARTPLRERWLAISILAAAFATTACGGQAATPRARLTAAKWQPKSLLTNTPGQVEEFGEWGVPAP